MDGRHISCNFGLAFDRAGDNTERLTGIDDEIILRLIVPAVKLVFEITRVSDAVTFIDFVATIWIDAALVDFDDVPRAMENPFHSSATTGSAFFIVHCGNKDLKSAD